MIQLIKEHQILFWFIVWLIGAILAYGRVLLQICHDFTKPIPKGIIIIHVLASWLGFLIAVGFWYDNAKFFRWLPILLLCISCMGCVDLRDGAIVSSIFNSKNRDLCHYFTKNSDNGFWADCSLYKVGDTIHFQPSKH